jgi:hypothetical protein
MKVEFFIVERDDPRCSDEHWKRGKILQKSKSITDNKLAQRLPLHCEKPVSTTYISKHLLLSLLDRNLGKKMFENKNCV